MTQKKNLNIISPINQTSYGLLGMNFVYQLWESKKFNISLFPINEQSMQAEPKFYNCLSEVIGNKNYFDKNATSLRIWHQFDMSLLPGKGKHIGFTVFELDNLTELERFQLNTLDELILCSEWGKQVCIKNDIKIPLHVVPLGYDPDIFQPKLPIESNSTIFLHVGKFEYRKSSDLLPKLFGEAFNQDDDVELWVCGDNVHLSKQENDEWYSLFKNSKLGNKIKMIPRQESQNQIAYLMNKSTVGLYPSKAEGYNLDGLESLACNKPIIILNYGGQTEYINNDCCVLIEPDVLEVAIDGKWFVNDGRVNTGNWLKITPKIENEFIKAMRWVHQNPNQVKQMSLNCINSTRNFTWKKSAQTLSNILQGV